MKLSKQKVRKVTYKFIATLLLIIVLLLIALIYITVLYKSNIFSKSIILDNNYFLKDYSKTTEINEKYDKKVVLEVPYISQQNSMPNGCEAVSATMLLQSYGFNITADDFVNNYLNCEPVVTKWGCRYGPDPQKAYAGDPYSKEYGFGCFSPVIVKACNRYLSDGYYAKNISGISFDELIKKYIDNGDPVLVWLTLRMEKIDKLLQWQSYDKKETFLYPANEHCMVLIGYDSENYIFADPYQSSGIVYYPIKDTIKAYVSLGSQAVVIVNNSI